jgi:D-sedoheptulose 7-phosphate isomerase
MVDRFGQGGRLFTFGNGGSATDAMSVAALFSSPPWGVPLPAHTLVTDPAVVTAIGNDVGFGLVFSRQLIAYSKSADIAIGLSTSGNSRNVLTAFGEACKRGNLTIGFAGYDGGDIGRSGDVEHCFVVESDSVHRIQEAQAALAFALWAAVQQGLAEVGGDRG